MKILTTGRKKILARQRGDTVLEFAAALPLFLLLIGGIGIFAWVFWAQAAADVAAVKALKEGGLNRNGDAVNPGAASRSFQSSMDSLTGPRTAGTVGNPKLSSDFGRHMVQLDVAGQIQLLFGSLDSLFRFGGGGAGRLWRFWPGPPSPWE